MLIFNWTKAGSVQPYGFCLYMPLTNVIHCQTLAITGMDLASVYCPGRYLIILLQIWLKNFGSGLILPWWGWHLASRLTWWKQRTRTFKLSSDLHTYWGSRLGLAFRYLYLPALRSLAGHIIIIIIIIIVVFIISISSSIIQQQQQQQHPFSLYSLFLLLSRAEAASAPHPRPSQ